MKHYTFTTAAGTSLLLGGRLGTALLELPTGRPDHDQERQRLKVCRSRTRSRWPSEQKRLKGLRKPTRSHAFRPDDANSAGSAEAIHDRTRQASGGGVFADESHRGE